jgi:hypothetical protein
MLGDLIRPFAYVTLKHPSNTPKLVNWTVPVGISLLAAVTVWWSGAYIDMLGPNGVVSRVLGFVQNLAGFYVAALAAIATFSSSDMDKLMPGEPPTMKVRYHGHLQTVKVTRRRFLSVMFAYLTALSLLLTLGSIAALAIADPLAHALSDQATGVLKAIFSVGYLGVLAQMTCVTLWGLFYLGERIHTPDS